MEYILPLDKIGTDKSTYDYVGNKAALLGFMKQKGIHVPDGFVLTTHLYDYCKRVIDHPLARFF